MDAGHPNPETTDGRRRWWALAVLALVAQCLVVTLAEPAAQAGSYTHGLATLYVNPGGGLQADGSDGLRLQINGASGRDEIRYRDTTQYCCSSRGAHVEHRRHPLG